jgi:hypothetical protein
MAASKVEKIEWLRDESLLPNEFKIGRIEYGPDPKATPES